MKRTSIITAAVTLVALLQTNPAQADNNSEKNNQSVINLSTKWIAPTLPISAKTGSEVTLKLNYVYTGSNIYNVKGDTGKKTLVIQNLTPLASPIAFIGQNVEVVSNSDLQALSVGTKIQKVRGNVITLNNSLKSSINGTVKISGSGNVDKNAFIQVFATTCAASNTPPVLIYAYSPTSKSEEDSNSNEGNSTLSFKWKVSKTQAVGCYNAFARFTNIPGSAVSMVAVPSDLKNPASITVVAKGKSKD